jgi:hypothetical protein
MRGTEVLVWPSPLEPSIRSDVVGTLPSGILGSSVSPHRFAPDAGALGCSSAVSTRVEGPRMATPWGGMAKAPLKTLGFRPIKAARRCL